MKNKRKLVLVGGGGHCKSVINSIERLSQYDEVVITDPLLQKEKCDMIMNCRVAGDDSMLEELYFKGFREAFITVGFVKSSMVRRRLYEKITEIGFDLVNIIDPSAVVSEHAVLGHGIYVGKNSIINVDAVVGDCSIINNGAIVEHECIVGDFSHVAVGAVLCGEVMIGNDTLVGAGSVVLQGLRVGSNVIVGAGSTVLADVSDYKTVYGKVKSGEIE